MEVVPNQSNQKKVPEAESQKIKSKLARASWKYHFFKESEVEDYALYLTDSGGPRVNIYRKSTLTRLNFFKPSSISCGKYIVDKFFTKYHIGFKVGEFTKNRKPFYFRSKKKKIVTKKYKLSNTTKNFTPKC